MIRREHAAGIRQPILPMARRRRRHDKSGQQSTTSRDDRRKAIRKSGDRQLQALTATRSRHGRAPPWRNRPAIAADHRRRRLPLSLPTTPRQHQAPPATAAPPAIAASRHRPQPLPRSPRSSRPLHRAADASRPATTKPAARRDRRHPAAADDGARRQPPRNATPRARRRHKRRADATAATLTAAGRHGCAGTPKTDASARPRADAAATGESVDHVQASTDADRDRRDRRIRRQNAPRNNAGSTAASRDATNLAATAQGRCRAAAANAGSIAP